MKEISKILYKTLFLILLMFSVSAESKIVFEGKSDAKVIVKVFIIAITSNN